MIDEKKKRLFIVRGPVGTGKSTVALAIASKYPDMKHLEADMCFTDKDGVYRFNLAELGRVYEWCATEAESLMSEGVSLVVSNPFSQLWEMEIYLVVAARYEYEVIMIDCMHQFGNPHQVEQKVIDAQRKRWETAEDIQKFYPEIQILPNPNK